MVAVPETLTDAWKEEDANVRTTIVLLVGESPFILNYKTAKETWEE